MANRLTAKTVALPNISAFTRVFDALRGEGWGEGVTALSKDLNPLTPALSPPGRATVLAVKRFAMAGCL